ncbi:MAG: DMT family transporter [Gemmataceae bacterium]
MQPTWMVVALAAGAILPVQVAVNAALRRQLGSAFTATLASFTVGTLAALGLCVLLRQPTPIPSADRPTAWWMWLGGLLGVVYVGTSIVVTPRLGTALTLGLVVAGQMVTALTLDHIGAFGLVRRETGWPQMAGAALIVAGVLLVTRRPG